MTGTPASKKEFKSAHVIQFPELLKTIKDYKEQRLSEAAVNHINEQLTLLSAVDRKEKKKLKAEHMQSVRKAKGAKQPAQIKASHVKEMVKEDRPSVSRVCPTCGGQLSKKKGRYGEFYGCGNYPSCRYTEKVG